MDTGFVPDRSYASVLRSQWCEGVPEKGFLGNIKLAGLNMMPLVAYRCRSCGFVEFYADASQP